MRHMTATNAGKEHDVLLSTAMNGKIGSVKDIVQSSGCMYEAYEGRGVSMHAMSKSHASEAFDISR
jgi:hypothetical protein